MITYLFGQGILKVKNVVEQCGYFDHFGDRIPHFPHDIYGEAINFAIHKYDLVAMGLEEFDEEAPTQTFVGAHFSSAIDHFIVSEHCRELVENFTIRASLISDHYPLIMTLKRILPRQKRGRAADINIDTQGTNGVSIKWTDVNPTTFIDNLVGKKQNDINICLDSSSFNLDVLSAFCNITNEIAEDLKSKQKRKNCNQNPRWFN